MPTTDVATTETISQDYDYSTLYKSPAGIAVHQQWYENKLRDFKVPHERRLVNTRFGHTHALVLGPTTAPPLVLLHSLVESVLEWENQLTYFARAQTHRVYAIDLIGQSPASAPVRPNQFNSDCAIWLLEVLAELGIKKADFVGLGYGTGFIIKLAGYTPGRINSAVLINPQGVAGVNSSPLKVIRALFALYFPSVGNVRRLIRDSCAPHTRLDDTIIQNAIAHFKMMRKYLKTGTFFDRFSDEQLSKLTAPTLVLVGQHNTTLKLPELADRLRRNLPRLSFELVPNAGFAVDIEQSGFITQEIANFLRYVAAYYGAPGPSSR